MRRPAPWLALMWLVALALAPAATAWQRELNGALWSFTLTPTGDVAACGFATALDSNGAFLVAKISGDRGKILWRYVAPTFGVGYTTDFAEAVALAPNGDVVATGSTANYIYDRSALAVRLDGATGARQWAWAAHGALSAVAIDAAGAIFVAGGLGTATGVGSDVAVAKLAPDGTELWRRSVAAAGTADSIALDASGDVLVVGSACSTTPDQYDICRASGRNLVVAKLTGADGSPMWQGPVLADDPYRPAVLRVDPANDVVVAASTLSLAGSEFTVMKLSGADGTSRWRKNVDAGGGRGYAISVALDASGDVLATGATTNVPRSGTDFAVAKLAGADGSEAWRYVIAGTDSATDLAASATPDAAGNVIATGSVASRMRVVELARDTGALLEQWDIASGDGSGSGDVVAAPPGAIVVGGSGGNGFFVGKFSDRLTGKKLSFTDPTGNPAGRVFSCQSSDPDLIVGGSRGAEDPTVVGGTLELRNPASGEVATWSLPASGWSATRGSYRYSDRTLAAGPCRKVSLIAKQGLKADCRGAGIGFSLDEPSQGALAVRVVVGGMRYCLRFGGTIKADAPGQFKAMAAPAPAGCD